MQGKANFVINRRKPDIDSFSTSGDIWARRWLRWHDLVSPCENVHEKNFFSPNDSKWSNSRKKHVSRNSKIFCPYDLILARHLENFRPKIFSTKKIFFSPNDSKWSNSRKKHVTKNSKNFCPYDLTLARHLENFRPKFFRIWTLTLHICQLYEKHSSNHLFPLSLVCSYWT